MKKIEQNFLSILSDTMMSFYSPYNKKYIDTVRNVCECYTQEYSTRYQGYTLLISYQNNKIEAELTKIQINGMSVAVYYKREDDGEITIGINDISVVEFK